MAQSTAVKVSDYQLLDHGVDGEQYFQGCGVAYTEYDSCVTGCGENFPEALEDALEQLAEDGADADDLETRIKADEGYSDKPWPTEPSAMGVFQKYNPEAYDEETDERDYDECDLYYYVSIRYKLDATASFKPLGER